MKLSQKPVKSKQGYHADISFSYRAKFRAKQKSNFKKYTVLVASVATLSLVCAEPALAEFDLDKGIKAATDPLVALITKYYGVGIAVGASAGALVGQGDMRTKAINAGIGAGVSGGVILALLKALT